MISKQSRGVFDASTDMARAQVISLEPVMVIPSNIRQCPASVQAFFVEPLVVVRQDNKPKSFLLVDGYLRLEAVKGIARDGRPGRSRAAGKA